MIPNLVTLGYRGPGGRLHRLYIPVLPVAVLLSPLLLLAVIAGLIVGRAYGISPAGALRGAGRLLWALPGTLVEIDDGQTTLLVSIK
jgi:hypothetical protein